MSSPEEYQIYSIQFVKESSTPIYIQFVEQFIKKIQLGDLDHGHQLPGTRKLAEILGLNRNTVVKGLEELQAQGWITIIPNKGTYVAVKTNQAIAKIKANNTLLFTDKANFKFEKSVLLTLPEAPTQSSIYLTDGEIDQNLIEYKIPAKTYNGILNRKTKIHENNNLFKKQFTNYLKLTRGITCTDKNILIANSQEVLLQIICKIMATTTINVAVPELSHYKSNMIFQSNPISLKQIKMNGNQLDLNHLEQLCKTNSIQIVYLSNNYHYPTTESLNFEEKNTIALLAKTYGFIVIEHDAYADYYYSPIVQLPYCTTTANQQTIYLSQFGNFLPKNYKFGFIVAPADFIAEAKKHLYLMESSTDTITQHVIAEMINEGEITRILKKQKRIYKERRDHLCNILLTTFGKNISIKLPKGGLAIWIEWQTDLNLMLLKKELEHNGIYIPQHCLYQTKKHHAIRLGFADLKEYQQKHVVNQLYMAYTKQVK